MNLPSIMVAPNGARKTKSDHPKMPVDIGEVVDATIEARAAGAEGLHAHVRDEHEHHVLDAGLYRELLAECETRLPGFYVQITTEAVGVYTPQQQVDLVYEVRPRAVSAVLREFLGGNRIPEGSERKLAREFYHWTREAQIDVQHILFNADEVRLLKACVDEGIIAQGSLKLMFVLGRYTQNMQSDPSDLDPYVAELEHCFDLTDELDRANQIDWAVCAFGKRETDCLLRSFELGGKARIGFENNIYNRDGTVADSNAERVRELVHLVTA